MRLLQELQAKVAQLSGEAPAPWRDNAPTDKAVVKPQLSYAEVVSFLRSEGVDTATVEAAAEKEKSKATAQKPPSSTSAHWRVQNLRSKLSKAEARVEDLRQQRAALDNELEELSTHMATMQAELRKSEQLHFKLQAEALADPLQVLSATLDDSVAQSGEGQAALATLIRLQEAAAAEKRKAEAEAAPVSAPPAPAGGTGVGGRDVAANDGDGDDIDMDLLEGDDFAARKQAFDTAMEELQAAKGGSQEVVDAAKRKYAAAAAAIGAKRARRGS